MIHKIDFKLQKKNITYSYIDGLIKILSKHEVEKSINSPLSKLDRIRSGLRVDSLTWDASTRTRIYVLIEELEQYLPLDNVIQKQIETETKKLCGRLRVKKHYYSKENKKVKVDIYASTKDALRELHKKFVTTDDDGELSWPELLDRVVDYCQSKLD